MEKRNETKKSVKNKLKPWTIMAIAAAWLLSFFVIPMAFAADPTEELATLSIDQEVEDFEADERLGEIQYTDSEIKRIKAEQRKVKNEIKRIQRKQNRAERTMKRLTPRLKTAEKLLTKLTSELRKEERIYQKQSAKLDVLKDRVNGKEQQVVKKKSQIKTVQRQLRQGEVTRKRYTKRVRNAVRVKKNAEKKLQRLKNIRQRQARENKNLKKRVTKLEREAVQAKAAYRRYAQRK